LSKNKRKKLKIARKTKQPCRRPNTASPPPKPLLGQANAVFPEKLTFVAHQVHEGNPTFVKPFQTTAHTMKNTPTKRKNKPRHDNDFIRKIRLHFGYEDQKEFAAQLNIHPSKLARLERGESVFKPEDKATLSAVTGIPEQEIEAFDPAKVAKTYWTSRGHVGPTHLHSP
jgi:DNA-binding transcriptional regulator YiaG